LCAYSLSIIKDLKSFDDIIIEAMSYLVVTDLTTSVTVPEHPYSFPLDPFQKHALRAIADHEHVLVCAKTGSGKTLVGEYQIYHSLKKGLRVFYTTPIKSLSNQKFYDLKHMYPTATVGIMTGDIKFCPNAQIVIMTTEILRNLLYKKGSSTEHLGITADLSLDAVDAVIFDECHYMNDKDRGMIWEETMILLPPEINMVMLSATLDHPERVGEWLGQLKKKPMHLIETHYRIVPLSHHLIKIDEKTEEYELVTLMDAKEAYHHKVYTDWIRARKVQKDAEYKQKLEIKEGKKDGKKIHIDHFVYHLNQTVLMLERKELLPAICFVLSRKLCESYAAKVEKDLLTAQETASVKHLIGFHLHRHMTMLETLPQYHQITTLLYRGIAYHHSGLLPLLKEIVEILFSKGLIKLLFCTETFAVGLNMPTKTVLFAGFKKYDEVLGDMRVLRNDEYIQMAGRAGRRGKDDKGIVIYLPDREPLDAHEMFSMMKGARPPITSKMTFHYDFILKTIQGSNEPLKWLQIMKQSYWFQQRQIEIKQYQDEKQTHERKMQISEYHEECQKRYDVEQKMKTHHSKEIQRELTSLKNKQLGPKWNKAWTDFLEYQKVLKHCEVLDERIRVLEDYESIVRESVEFLYRVGFVTSDDPYVLTKEHLTIKGILATEVNEGHPILMAELYDSGMLHALSGEDLITVLACFHEKKQSVSIDELNISQEAYDCLCNIQKMSDVFYKIDRSPYWSISTEMIEPISRWIYGEHSSVICQDYELFEGNFVRSVLKIGNIVDEWLNMAIYCQHTDQVTKIMALKEKMAVTQTDSLYLRL
jgi:superfamily II RNA helicase